MKKKLMVWKYLILVYHRLSQHQQSHNNALQTHGILINCVLVPLFY